MPGPAADQGVFHHHGAVADPDLAILGGEHSPDQDAGVRSDADCTAQDRCGRDVRAGMDLRCLTPMLNQHLYSLPGTAPSQRPPAAGGEDYISRVAFRCTMPPLSTTAAGPRPATLARRNGRLRP